MKPQHEKDISQMMIILFIIVVSLLFTIIYFN